MKKINYMFLLLVPVLLFGHGGEVHEDKDEEVTEKVEEISDNKKEVYAQINESYLKNVKPIFEVKCFNCHSDETKEYWYFDLPLVSSLIESDITEAKKHLDFSNDFPFISHETPVKDLVSILEVFEKRTMPPFRYTIMHSESEITDEDIKIVKQWVETSLDKL